MSDAVPDRLALLEHRAWVRALARRLLRDENDVDDVEQETWSVALHAGPDEPRALRSWLGVVASRLALQRLRGRNRRARREEAAARPERIDRSASEIFAEADAHGRVVQAVLALDEPYRATILLRYFEGLSIADVARRMEVPVETVRTRLRRAHDQLRGVLEDDDEHPLAILAAPFAGGDGAHAASGAKAPTTRAATTFARASVLAAAAVALVAGGAWMLTARFGGDGASDADDRNVAAAPRDAPGDDAPPAAKPDVPPPAPPPPAVSRKRERSVTEPASDTWIAYDLADGRPLPNFALRIRTVAGETQVTTDADGRIPADREKVVDVGPVDAAWKFARPQKGDVKAEPSLWFWRERTVKGTLRSSDAAKALNPGDATFTWRPAFELHGKPDEPGRGPMWFMQHDFDIGSGLPAAVRLDTEGNLSGSVAAVRGATLTAQANGFAPGACRLSWPADGENIVAIEMRPTVRVVGRVLDAAGEPVAGLRVSLDTAIEITSGDDLERARGLRPQGGFAFSGGPERGAVVFVDFATTDVRGIFRIDATAVGRSVVLVRSPGFLVCRRELGALAKDVEPFEMKLVRADARGVVRSGGTPVVSSAVTFQVADNRENGFQIPTDAAGNADLGWLERGRWYIVSYGAKHGFLRWDGQPAIDLEQLAKEPRDDK